MKIRGVFGRCRRDDGFSVVEVVFAAAILFVALTALIGLMGASSRMTASSRAKTILTNEVASQLDSARAIPFDNLALTTAVPPGQVPPTITYTKSGYTITMAYTITDRSAVNGTKEITVVGTISAPGFPDIRTSAFAAVRNRVGGSTVVDNNLPVIEIIDPTPPAETIVAGNQVSGGGNLNIVTRSTSTSHKIKSVEYLVGTSTMLKSGTTIYADPAQHDFSGDNAEETWSFQWHTRQVDQAGVPSVQDGARTIRVIATDDQDRKSPPAQRTFIVDNYPPNIPTGRNLSWTGYVDNSGNAAQSLSAVWNAAMDGTDVAPYHLAEVYENTRGESDFAQWSAPYSMQAPGKLPDDRLGAFGCYAIRVKSESPLHNSLGWGEAGPVYTRPTANGSSDVKREYVDKKNNKWTFTTRFSIPKPRFKYESASLRVYVQRFDSGITGSPTATTDITSLVTAAWLAGDSYAYTDAQMRTTPNATQPTRPTYRVAVTVTPIGWGAAPQTLYSNYATPWLPVPISIMPVPSSTTPAIETNKPLTVAW